MPITVDRLKSENSGEDREAYVKNVKYRSICRLLISYMQRMTNLGKIIYNFLWKNRFRIFNYDWFIYIVYIYVFNQLLRVWVHRTRTPNQWVEIPEMRWRKEFSRILKLSGNSSEEYKIFVTWFPWIDACCLTFFTMLQNIWINFK